MSSESERTGELKPGARPIRMRGYYRAVKRGEAWAVRIHRMPEGLGKLFALVYRNLLIDILIPNRNPFLSSAPYSSVNYHMPVILSSPDPEDK